MDVHRKLDELVALVEGARAMPMSASCVVNRAETLAMLDDLRKNLPGQLAEARQIVAERDAVVEDGRREAQRLIEEARAERSRMLAATPDAREAVAEADRLRSHSLEEIEAMRAEVDEYVDSKLANFEVVLTRTMSAVQRGRERLRGGHHTDELRREDPADNEAVAAGDPAAPGGSPLAGSEGAPQGGFDSREPHAAPGSPGADPRSEGLAAYAASGFVTGEYPSVDRPSGEYAGGGYPSGEYAGAGYASGEYAAGGYPSGEYAGAGYASGEHAAAGYPSGEYAAGYSTDLYRAPDHPSGDFPRADQPTGDFVRGDYLNGEHAGGGVAGGGGSPASYPRAADYPGSVEYPQPADYSVSGYPGLTEPEQDDVANPGDFGTADEHAHQPAYPHYSGYPAYGDR